MRARRLLAWFLALLVLRLARLHRCKLGDGGTESLVSAYGLGGAFVEVNKVFAADDMRFTVL